MYKYKDRLHTQAEKDFWTQEGGNDTRMEGRDMQTGLWWGKSWKGTTCKTISVGNMK
jgi:hypothetical protein